MQNVKTTKNKSYLDLAYRVSVAKQKADNANKLYKDLQKELKASNAEFLPVEWLTVPFTIVNGFTKEICNTQTIQNRSVLNMEAVCHDLKVSALTVENGYKTPQPVMCLKVGAMSGKGFK